MQPQAVSVGGIPLDEYSKSVPPGWRGDIDTYAFKRYLERLKLWGRITDVAHNVKGAVVVGRLRSDAYKIAMGTKIRRVRMIENAAGVPEPKLVTFTGDDAVCEPTCGPAHDNPGNLLLGAQIAGVRAMLGELRG